MTALSVRPGDGFRTEMDRWVDKRAHKGDMAFLLKRYGIRWWSPTAIRDCYIEWCHEEYVIRPRRRKSLHEPD